MTTKLNPDSRLLKYKIINQEHAGTSLNCTIHFPDKTIHLKPKLRFCSEW